MMNVQDAALPPAVLAKLLSAPVAEYMSPEQLAFFQDLLCAERDVLLRAARETTDQLQVLEPTPDPSDRASLEEDHLIEFRVRDRERKHLHAIDRALQRIRDGSYGWCEETGEPIGIPRLLTRPTATLTLESQERRESTQRMRGR
ncbi:RNA polymerase-binding transcription factor DksA [mine drainage metagenome]|uniref:RNA polymerase-binding transcription factor DksA n=1 Tax=mine drainage metagenome TaxID=410659 RepID=A0A1J5RK58_9ZZZZ